MAKARIEREPLSAVDAAWLHMEKPTSTAVITGVWFFDEPLDFERYKRTIECTFLRYKRFRMRIRNRFGNRSYWETDPCFTLESHLHRIALPSPGDQTALQKLTGDLMSTPLDFNKPLWQIYFVENYGQGTALITRLHHCIADGMALMHVMLSMTTDCSDAPEPEPFEEKTRAVWDPLKPVRSTLKTARSTLQLTETIGRESIETIRHPSRLVDAALIGMTGILAFDKLLLLGSDEKTIFKSQCGPIKRTAWSAPYALTDVKLIGRELGGTVNDVLLAAYTGTLRRYLEEHQQPVEDLNLRAFIPVNLRPQEDYRINELGNKFGLVYLSLPVGVEDYIQRLKVINQRMTDIKETPEALVAFGILNVAGMSPTQVEDIILKIFGMKGTMVITNVPGPREVRYMAGKPIRGAMFWVPSPADLGMGVSIFSYANEVIIGVNTDAGVVPDPEHLISLFDQEFNQMLEQAKKAAGIVEQGTAKTAMHDKKQVTAPPVTTRSLELEAPQANGRCQATTKSGERCRNIALPGMTTCRIHQKQVVKA
jgi:WS/DGAT/MGAT family acyltransferase